MAAAKKTVLGRLLRWGVRLALVLVVVLIGTLAFAGRFVTAQFLVDEVEESINCRMEIGEVKVSAVRWPARVVLKEIRLGERDESVGLPLDERSPMEEAAVEVGEVRLQVSLFDLLFRKVDVRELTLESPSVAMTIGEDGEIDLQEMFRSAPEREEERRREGKKESGALNLEEVGMLARLKEVKMLDSAVTVHLEETGMMIEVRNFSLFLGEIEVDPSDLAQTNEAKVRMEGEVTLAWSDEDREPSGYFDFDGEATATLFDPASADLDPEVTGVFALGEKSYLSARVPPISKSWSKIGRVANIGLKFAGLPERATFGRGATVGIRYFHERLTTIEPMSLWLGDWELAVLKDSWVDLADEEHEITGEFVASTSMSGKLRSGIMKGVGYVPDSVEEEVGKAVEAAWFPEGRMLVRVRSSEKLSDPEVDVLNKFPNMKEIVKGALEEKAKDKLKDLGGSLLKGLLDDDDDDD